MSYLDQLGLLYYLSRATAIKYIALVAVVENGLCTCMWWRLRTWVFEVQTQSQRRDVAQRAGSLVVVVCVVGRSEKFSHGMVRSRKPLLMVPLHNIATTVPLLSTYIIQRKYTAFNNIPWPLTESINNFILMDEQMNKWISKYTAPFNPQGSRPRSMRSLAVLLP